MWKLEFRIKRKGPLVVRAIHLFSDGRTQPRKHTGKSGGSKGLDVRLRDIHHSTRWGKSRLIPGGVWGHRQEGRK